MASKIPRWSRGLLAKRPEVILSATIEYSQTSEKNRGYLGQEGDELQQFPQKLESQVKEIIEHRLPADLEDLFGISAEIEVRGCRYGSLVVFFSVLLSSYTIIASYKSFYDSIHLIREHCALLVNKLLRDRYGPETFRDVVVKAHHPTLPNPHDYYPPSRLWKRLGVHPSELPWELPPPQEHPRRDGFFWFLLVLCVLLLAALGLLVYAAVVHTYFPDPISSTVGLLL